MARKQDLQKMHRLFKEQTGAREVDPHVLADWLLAQGYKPPVPKKPVDILAKQISEALREEYRTDAETGRQYRANHSIKRFKDGNQLHLWIDIDEATREQMHLSLTNRREQMVGDGFQLTLDADHWNSVNPSEEPLQIELDFTFDIEIRKNTPPD